jgi:hypothetical protein
MLRGHQAWILERSAATMVAAEVRLARSSDKVLWSRWHTHMRRDAEDAHWEWDELIELAAVLPERFAVYSLVAAGELQGLRMLEVSEDEVERYGVHALRLSTAPWNRGPSAKYHGVGSVLVATAILRSHSDNRDGRTHCESLPDAEHFHERNGMLEFDGRSSEGLKRYRFDEAGAARFVERLVSEGMIQWPI